MRFAQEEQYLSLDALSLGTEEETDPQCMAVSLNIPGDSNLAPCRTIH